MFELKSKEYKVRNTYRGGGKIKWPIKVASDTDLPAYSDTGYSETV